MAVHFTLCFADRIPYFTTEERVAPHREVLIQEVEQALCIAYAYCFMPDHLHTILLGVDDKASPKKAVDRFKQRSGFLLRNEPAKWQPSYFDHILRTNEDTPAQVLYVFNNPLRAGLTDDPFSYPFSGCIGTDYREVLETIL